MSLIDFMLNNIKVTQTEKAVIFSGFRTKWLFREIERVMETTRFQKGIVSHLGSLSFRVPLFFCYDFLLILESTVENHTRYYNVEITKKVLSEFRKVPIIEQTTRTFPSKLNTKALGEFTVTPLEHQSEFFEIYDQKTQQYGMNGYILGASPGSGKALPLDSLVLTPSGWKRMGEMSVGTEVIAADGSTTVVTGVYPQGSLPNYRVRFFDGRTVECSGDHLWKVHFHIPSEKKWKVINLYEISRQLANGNDRMHIQLFEPPEGIEKDLPIDPYYLGLLLGNGGFSSYSVGYSTQDHDTAEGMSKYFQKSGLILKRKSKYDYVFCKDPDYKGEDFVAMATRLASLRIHGKLSYQKFVPNDYLYGSRSQRLAMVQGLMDSDGTTGLWGGVSFCTTSERLSEDFAYLIRSLGGMATICKKIPFYTYRGERRQGRLAYIIHVRYKRPNELFRVERKKSRVGKTNQYSKGLKLRIESVELIGSAEMQCISVAHPDQLFVTNNFVVTHNTLSALMLGWQLKDNDVVVVISPSNALYEVWEETVVNKIKGDVPYYVYGKGKPEIGKKVYIFSHDNMKFAKEIILGMLSKKKIFIIVDECHAFNELKSDRTNLLIEVCQKVSVKNMVWMSGTPFKAFGREVIPFLYSADPKFNEDAANGFIKIFGVRGTYALDILSARIGRTVHLIEKANVIKNKVINLELKVKVPNGERFTMPAIRKAMEKFVLERVSYYEFHSKRLEGEYLRIRNDFGKYLTGEQKKEFDDYCSLVETIRYASDLSVLTKEMEKCNKYEKKVIIPALSSEEKKIFRDTKSVYKYVSLKIQGEALGRILGRERTLCNVEILKHLDSVSVWCEELKYKGESFELDDIFAMSESKVVFFTDYVEVLQEAEVFLKKKGYNPRAVYGETNKDLSEILDKAANDPKVNPIVATMKSLSTAVPLIFSDTIVLLNVPYRDYIYKQTVARVDRLGQKHTVKIFHVYLDTGDIPNISTRSKDLMEWSRQMVEKLLGIKTGDVEEIVEEEFLSSFAEGFSIKVKNLLGWK